MEWPVSMQRQSSNLLGEKLKTHISSKDTVIVSVSRESATTAYHLAEKLHVPWQVIGCREIKDPTNSDKTIGSVSSDEVIINDSSGIPGDFIDHQVQIIQSSLKSDNLFFSTIAGVHDLKYKTVVVVCEYLTNYDSVAATLKSISKQRPLKTILASLVVEPEAARIVASATDAIVFLRMDSSLKAGDHYANSAFRKG